MAKVLQAKYYANSDFMGAELRNQPSNIWRSIWSSKGLLLKGCSWIVGDGASISVSDAAWLPDKKSYSIQMSKVRSINKVSELIDD